MSTDALVVAAAIVGNGFGITLGLAMIDRRLRAIVDSRPVEAAPDPEPVLLGNWVSPPPEAETAAAPPLRAWPFATDPEGARLRSRGGYPSGQTVSAPPPPPGRPPGR